MILLIHILAKKRLKADAVPSISSWNKDKQEKVQPLKRSALGKLNQWRAEEEEATDTASEGEGDMAVSTRSGEELISRKTQTYEDDICSKLDEHLEFLVYMNFLHPTYFPNVQPQRKKINCSHILLDLTVMVNS